MKDKSNDTPPPHPQMVGSEPVGYCVWITPTKLAACAKSAKGAFPVYASPDIDGSSFESCQRCQGNGEIVTDWERYMRAHEDENGNESVAECPDCGGEGIIDTAPADQMVATKSESTVDQTAGSKFGSIFPRKSPEEVSRDPAYRKVQQELSGLRASIEGTETAHTDQVMGCDTSEFYLNSGEPAVVDRGFMVSIANLLEHGAFEENTTDADTATEYANELYRVLFAQRGGKKNGEMLNLLSAARGLKRIVEEIDGAMKHGTWRDEHGARLKDTPEWIALYNALPALSAPEAEG